MVAPLSSGGKLLVFVLRPHGQLIVNKNHQSLRLPEVSNELLRTGDLSILSNLLPETSKVTGNEATLPLHCYMLPVLYQLRTGCINVVKSCY